MASYEITKLLCCTTAGVVVLEYNTSTRRSIVKYSRTGMYINFVSIGILLVLFSWMERQILVVHDLEKLPRQLFNNM
jgi:hypothetical protein